MKEELRSKMLLQKNCKLFEMETERLNAEVWELKNKISLIESELEVKARSSENETS